MRDLFSYIQHNALDNSFHPPGSCLNHKIRSTNIIRFISKELKFLSPDSTKSILIVFNSASIKREMGTEISRTPQAKAALKAICQSIRLNKI